MISAEEARKLSDTPDLSDVEKEIVEACKQGDKYIIYHHVLFDDEKKYLRSLGYSVSSTSYFVADSYEDSIVSIRIDWDTK